MMILTVMVALAVLILYDIWGLTSSYVIWNSPQWTSTAELTRLVVVLVNIWHHPFSNTKSWYEGDPVYVCIVCRTRDIPRGEIRWIDDQTFSRSKASTLWAITGHTWWWSMECYHIISWLNVSRIWKRQPNFIIIFFIPTPAPQTSPYQLWSGQCHLAPVKHHDRDDHCDDDGGGGDYHDHHWFFKQFHVNYGQVSVIWLL